jgi:hypothetical protein
MRQQVLFQANVRCITVATLHNPAIVHIVVCQMISILPHTSDMHTNAYIFAYKLQHLIRVNSRKYTIIFDVAGVQQERLIVVVVERYFAQHSIADLLLLLSLLWAAFVSAFAMTLAQYEPFIIRLFGRPFVLRVYSTPSYSLILCYEFILCACHM